jgi:hypothetical protein
MKFSAQSFRGNQLCGCLCGTRKLDASQAQFVSGDDARAVSATFGADQMVWSSSRFGAAAQTADRKRRYCNR